MTTVNELLDFHRVDTAVRAFIARRHRLLIDGAWREAASRRHLDVFEPSTGQELTTIAAGERTDVDLAVQAAQRALRDGRWSRLPPARREQVLLRFADLIERDAAMLATIETIDNGKPIVASRDIDVPEAVRFARYMAGWSTKIDGRSVALSAAGAPYGLTIKEPVGVVGAIVPWNLPLNMAVQKLFPALAAGCSIVLKPAEQTSLSALRLGELSQEAGVPDGVIAIVTGTGPAAGEALAQHPHIAKLTFTGSTAVGVRVGQLALHNMTRLTLELGGKSPMIVLPDCDLDRAAQGVVDGIFFNAGQVCCASSRLYVHREIHDELIERVASRAKSLRVGAGLDPGSEMGPLVSERQRDRVRGYIEIGVAEGASMIAGGDWNEAGYFVQPTVFARVPPGSRVIREEIFGPVIAAAPFTTDEEALELANDTRFGLAASIWSNDLNRVRHFTRGLRAGTVWVNAHNPVDAALPFGGYGMSGFGREGGPENLDAYLETKSVWIA